MVHKLICLKISIGKVENISVIPTYFSPLNFIILKSILNLIQAGSISDYELLL